VSVLFTGLIKKNKVFTWTENEKVVFKELKRRFLEVPILAIFNLEKHIVLEIDVFDYAIGVCIN
jgi:hypothetical protein